MVVRCDALLAERYGWRNSANTALLIYSTTAPTPTRLPTLRHNPQYRAQVAAQNAGYHQPPHPSFYPGAGMGTFVQEPVHTPGWVDWRAVGGSAMAD